MLSEQATASRQARLLSPIPEPRGTDVCSDTHPHTDRHPPDIETQAHSGMDSGTQTHLHTHKYKHRCAHTDTFLCRHRYTHLHTYAHRHMHKTLTDMYILAHTEHTCTHWDSPVHTQPGLRAGGGTADLGPQLPPPSSQSPQAGRGRPRALPSRPSPGRRESARLPPTLPS